MSDGHELTAEEETEDMAAVGRQVMDAIDSLVGCEGPLKDWAPAESPAEIVIDLVNMLDDATAWRTAATYEKDGRLVLLMVEGGDFNTEDAVTWRTIGSNNYLNDGEDKWTMAGWCWDHDHYTAGEGTVIGWLPLPDLREPAL